MVLKYVWAFLFGLVFLYIQLLLMPGLALGGVIPNILLAWLIFNIWSKPTGVSSVSAFLIGIMYDTTLPSTFGMNTLIFVLLCVIIDLFRKPFEVDSIVAKILTLVIGNLVYAVIMHLIMGLGFGFTGELFRLVLISFAYNLGLSFVVFWAMTFLSKLRLCIVND